jgi:acyl-CoA reductase-like NAD-dependent aldehyde dehydrogenase
MSQGDTDESVEAKKAGGQVILGGGAVDGKPGFFLQPTVIKSTFP